ncbi:MAG: nucleoside hydrolase [Prevotella sp.]|nr:nucleoside hydrolase [Prevotella sp.]
MKTTLKKKLFGLSLSLFVAVIAIGIASCSSTKQVVNNAPSVQKVQKAEPINLILDADFGSSTDDLFALMMINHFMDEGRVDLKGVIVDREGAKNAGVVDIFNTYYGHPNVPVGLERNGVKNPRCFIPYNGICDLKDVHGNPMFKRSFDENKCMEGYKLYRKLLSEAKDKSITVVAIGFMTTIAQLFESGADEYSKEKGVDLFGKKVKAVYIQSGRFEAGDSLSGYNMRAASKQAAVFYNNLPKDVDIIMSPSNIGDLMDYSPKDVLADLSTTERNPIKAVYTHYTCDTGQRMWDTNCLVNAVDGDEGYYLSPRGWVTFVDLGEASQMLFKVDPAGNARYQMPGDSYFAQEKLMEIRRYNRINKYPSQYTIESPQPILTRDAAVEWTRPRLTQLMDKYLGTAGNSLDLDELRNVFRPIGYYGANVGDYRKAEKMLVDTLYTEMLHKAANLGKKSLFIVTGSPSSGKSTVMKQMDLSKVGLVFESSLNGQSRLENVIEQAKQEGFKDITVMMVYNDLLTCFKNSISKGKQTNRFVSLGYLVNSFRDNISKLNRIHKQHPDVEIIPMDCAGNKKAQRVSFEEAANWNYKVSNDDVHALLSYLKEQIAEGDLDTSQLSQIARGITRLDEFGEENLSLARDIERQISEKKQ